MILLVDSYISSNSKNNYELRKVRKCGNLYTCFASLEISCLEYSILIMLLENKKQNKRETQRELRSNSRSS